MGVISAFVGYTIYQFIYKRSRQSQTGRFLGAALGAWLGVECAAIAASLQLAASGTSPLQIALPAMAGVHALIGLGEALITVAALAFIGQTRPELLRQPAKRASQGSGWIATGLLVALLIACFSPLANPNPDGLERVAADHGFLGVAQASSYQIFPDYSLPFIQDPALTTILAGIIGVLLVAAVAYTVARLNRPQDSPGPAANLARLCQFRSATSPAAVFCTASIRASKRSSPLA